jgi:hypothetical protein
MPVRGAVLAFVAVGMCGCSDRAPSLKSRWKVVNAKEQQENREKPLGQAVAAGRFQMVGVQPALALDTKTGLLCNTYRVTPHRAAAFSDMGEELPACVDLYRDENRQVEEVQEVLRMSEPDH